MQRLDRVAVRVLRVVAFQRQPRTDIVPVIRGVHHQHLAGLRGVLHHGEVDADLLGFLVLGAEYFRSAWRAPRGGDAHDRRVQFRLASLKFAENGGGFHTKMPLFQK